MPVIEAEKQARYANWLNILSKCAKCQAIDSITLHYRDGVRCAAQSPWNWKVSTQNEKLQGLCKDCRPTKEESNALKAQHGVVSPKTPAQPSRYAEEGEKLDWASNEIVALSMRFVDVFGEAMPIADIVARIKAGRDVIRTWKESQSQGGVGQ